MAELIDYYLLLDSREVTSIQYFLDMIIPTRKEISSEYLFPQYLNEISYHFNDVKSLMTFLQKNGNYSYSIYWKNLLKNDIYKNGMLFYTNDGNVIVGASIIGKSHTDINILREYLKIKNLLNLKVGCITVEEAPPDNSIDFKDFCKKRYPNYLGIDTMHL